MKIGIIGAGTVGQSMGKALARVGHEVMFSSRAPQSVEMQTLVRECGDKAQVGTTAETAAFSDILIMALRWDAVADVLKSTEGWSNKIIIDLMNRFNAPPGSASSTAQDLAKLTGARVVKAFNTIGAEHYQDPNFGGQAASMFIAGDDAGAKRITSELATGLGFEVVDTGGLTEARMLENLAELWVHLAFRAGLGRDIAFKIIRKS